MKRSTFGRREQDQSFNVSEFHHQHPFPSSSPTTPTFVKPRKAPPVPTSPKPSSIRSFNSLFRSRHRAPSVLSTNTDISTTDTLVSHPFAAMHLAPLPVVSSHDADLEEDCPVCLEPLSFSFRLPGEKPHIVPECGHALHEVRRSYLSLLFLAHRPSRRVLQPYMAHHQVRRAQLYPASQTSVSAASADGR